MNEPTDRSIEHDSLEEWEHTRRSVAMLAPGAWAMQPHLNRLRSTLFDMTIPEQVLSASMWAAELLNQTLPGDHDRLTADDLDRLTAAICIASDGSLKWYRSAATSVENKKANGFDPVTEADREVERY